MILACQYKYQGPDRSNPKSKKVYINSPNACAKTRAFCIVVLANTNAHNSLAKSIWLVGNNYIDKKGLGLRKSRAHRRAINSYDFINVNQPK